MKKLIGLGLLLTTVFGLAACGETASVVASTIAIDVNPSVELDLDENDKVLNVIMNNEDAVIIVGDMDLVGVDYNIAINALIGSMVQNGYITEFTNSVLISVHSEDAAKEALLMVEVTEAVSAALGAEAIEGSIITKEYSGDDADVEELSELLDISEARADLILDILELDPRVTAEELALLSINDLNLYLESKNYKMDDVEKTGVASILDYITSEEAYQLALTSLELDTLDVIGYKIELEQDHGIMVYEVDIEISTDKYEVLIDAKEGTVVVKNNDDNDDVFPTDVLSSEEVMVIVLAELFINESEIKELEIEQKMENGFAYYEIEFELLGEEYQLEVSAIDGVILTNNMDEAGFEYQDDKDDKDKDDADDDFPTDVLSSEEVMVIVLAELSINEREILELETKLTMENELAYYEIEFELLGEEYQLEVSAIDGSILTNNMDDADDDNKDDKDADFPTDLLSSEEVMVIVLAELSINESEILELEIEQEMEDGFAYYEIEFELLGEEYQLEVSAIDGSILTNNMDDVAAGNDSKSDKDDDTTDDESTE